MITVTERHRAELSTQVALDDAVGSLASGGDAVVIFGNRAVAVTCAATVTTASMARLIQATSGFVQVALSEATCDRLLLPEAIPSRRDASEPTFGQCVAVDAAHGITTGISAADRARTARTLADPASGARHLSRPGHVLPVRVAGTGRPANLASVCLELSGRAWPQAPGAVFADLVSVTDGIAMADAVEAPDLAQLLGIPILDARALVTGAVVRHNRKVESWSVNRPAVCSCSR
jgi:3,4-dihydroxy-2-butanone 4-phosphate synthase